MHNRYNHYFESKFHGCHVIGHRDDPGRKRRVMVYAMPGDGEMIGLFDGVDAWVTEAKGEDLKRLQGIAIGEVHEIELGQHRRRFDDGSYVYGSEMAGFMGVSNGSTGRQRRRIGAEAPTPQPAPVVARRRVVGGFFDQLEKAATVTKERRRVQS